MGSKQPTKFADPPPDDDAAADAIGAFHAAEKASLPLLDCYLAGVAAWLRVRPGQQRSEAAMDAVAAILATRISLRIDE